MVDQGDLLALQVVHAAFLVADVLDQRRGLAPVGHRHGEHVGEDAAVAAVGAAVAHREHRDLVGGGPLDQRVGDAGAVRVDHRGAGRAALLQALVALDAAVVVVRGLALFPGQLDAVDAAVALVDQREVVVHRIRDRECRSGRRARCDRSSSGMNCSPSARASDRTPAVRPVATARPASAVFLRLMMCSLIVSDGPVDLPVALQPP